MNEGPSDPAQPPGPEPASKPSGSRFEDLSDFEVPVDAVATGARTPILITAAVVLFAGALFALLYLVLLLPFASSDRGSSVSAVVVSFLLVYGALQAVAGLLVAPEAEAPLVFAESVVAVAGRGIEGDRYGAGRGTFSGPGRGYQLTLIEAETLEELKLPWERARRNVVTRGASLNPLVGRRFRIGGVECIGRRLAEPCAHLEKLSGPGLLRPLVHRGGLRADILVGGTIRLGDEVTPID